MAGMVREVIGAAEEEGEEDIEVGEVEVSEEASEEGEEGIINDGKAFLKISRVFMALCSGGMRSTARCCLLSSDTPCYLDQFTIIPY